MSEVQFPHRYPHGFQRRGADRRVEAPKHFIVSGASNQPGPKTVSEEVEFIVRIRAFALPVFAVNDLGFRRMHLQAALCQALLKLCLESLSFLLGPAVHQPIICISTPRKVWVRPCHPEIERVMQEQVCQNRTDNAPLRGSTRSLSLHTASVFHWLSNRMQLRPPFASKADPLQACECVRSDEREASRSLT